MSFCSSVRYNCTRLPLMVSKVARGDVSLCSLHLKSLQFSDELKLKPGFLSYSPVATHPDSTRTVCFYHKFALPGTSGSKLYIIG